MDLDAAYLSPAALSLGWFGLAAALFAALAQGGWRRCLAAIGRHAALATLVALLVLWQMRAVTPLGPALHVLGATLAVLLLGPRAAFVGLLAVLAAHTLNAPIGFAAFGVNAMTMVALPVLVSTLILRLVTRVLPRQPFAYILLAAFAGGGVAMLSTVAASTALLGAASSLDLERVLSQYGASGVLLLFPEAFLTGTTIAWLAMFYPSVLATWRPPWLEARRTERDG